ncbi:glucoside xylosyltransferase 2-like isoform X1 [Mytilus californianus]|uniref:glucoside xylosyltransferase 2-like isoform X1 n=1 Tax=Mytilus californianus TaxID=6549 RepID=UPI0022456A1F|nr:glucoside xylosyltransferase 2-like isoform X1 [Mytilus californianus]
MKRKKKITFGITAVLLVAVYLYYFIQNEKSLNISLAGEEEDNNLNQESKIHEDDRHGKDTNRPRYSRHWKNGIHLSVVACGDRAEETIVLLKSAVLFTTGPLIFHIFAEFDFQPMFKQKLDNWPAKYKRKFLYYLYNVTFPTGNPQEWKKMFKPCATQRLFIPSLLKDVDSLLYVDTDILFLRPVDDIWRFFDQFNSAQLAALVPEHEDKAASNYRFARHPYYGESGLNSGVLLMNLTRIRKSTWIDSMVKYYIQYKPIIRYGDQDLLNIYFYHHIDELYVYSCEWNYRTDHCVNKSICKDIERNGVSVLHGSRRVMQNEDQPTFKAVYTAFKEHNISLRKERDLLTNLKKLLSKTSNSPCGQIGHLAYTKYIEEFVLERKTS